MSLKTLSTATVLWYTCYKYLAEFTSFSFKLLLWNSFLWYIWFWWLGQSHSWLNFGVWNQWQASRDLYSIPSSNFYFSRDWISMKSSIGGEGQSFEGEHCVPRCSSQTLFCHESTLKAEGTVVTTRVPVHCRWKARSGRLKKKFTSQWKGVEFACSSCVRVGSLRYMWVELNWN